VQKESGGPIWKRFFIWIKRNKMKRSILFVSVILSIFLTCCNVKNKIQLKDCYSGIYPTLAYYNNEGECGTGAVVPWADRLWVISYGPHLPFGSSDRLYEITLDLQKNVRPESIGGTPANRMIHRESNQLFIGPYAIDTNRRVRTIPYTHMPAAKRRSEVQRFN
jgi:hypothetical protein